MPEISETIERYKDWYCEELFRTYFSSLIELDELLLRLDYDRISDQKELYNFLNFLLTEKFPHKCYHELCDNKLYFSNTFDFAKKQLNLTMKEFVKIWIIRHSTIKLKVRSIEIAFFCCKCYEGRVKELI
ncbi:MAG: hypothetical protein ACXABG_09210 [Promethearchaeota archaeon]|jgi:hypothetical protein